MEVMSIHNSQKIKQHIHAYYESLYAQGHVCPPHLPMLASGKSLAKRLGYPLHLLGGLADDYWELFAACGNPLPFIKAGAGQWVLNLGCGAGIDSFSIGAIHEYKVRVVGLDLVAGILQKAQHVLSTLPQPPGALSLVCGDGEQLPYQSQTFDWVCMNGVFNLFPNKSKLLLEVRRVLKPGAQLVVVDLCSDAALPEYFDGELDAWAWCMSGALPEEAIRDLLAKADLDDIRLSCQETGEMFHRVVFNCRRSLS
jgi:arsenite methyltransferase